MNTWKVGRRIGRLAGFAACAICAVLVGGCVTVHIEDRTGVVRTTTQFGMLRVDIGRPDQAVMGSLSGVGVVSAPLGWSVGYTRQRWALIGDGCRAVVWSAPGGIDERTRDDLKNAAGVCLLADDGAAQAEHTSTTEEKKL